jgi:type I restriction enzyme, S subunit
VNSKTITLGDICFIEKGKIGIQVAIPGDYPLVTTAAERSSHNEYHFEGEAVCIPLVSATGHGHASIKRIHFQKGKFCVGNILCACIPKDYKETSAKFLHLYFSLLKDVILVPLMQGSANVSLKIKDLEKVEVPDVSFDRQLEIVDEFERLEVINKKLLTVLEQQQTYLQLLRQAILQEAVQGKLTKQDPTDEPATELLKRIKAEKEKLIKAGKLKKEKELPPIAEDEIPFELPKGWVWCRFGNASISRDGERVPLSMEVRKTRQGIYDYYGAQGVIDNIDDFLFDKSLLLIAEDGGNLLRRSKDVAYFAHGKYWVNNHAHVVDAVNFTTLKFLKIFINSVDLKPYLNGEPPMQIKLNRGKLNIIPVPFPPLAEQQRIVAKVQQLQQQLSQLEAQVQQSRQSAQQLLQSVLKEAFEQKGKVYEMEEDVSLVAEE